MIVLPPSPKAAHTPMHDEDCPKCGRFHIPASADCPPIELTAGMKIKGTHTPTPWKTNGGKHVYRQDHHIAMAFADRTGWLDGRPVPTEQGACANADFIVQACNAYEIMLKALKEVHWLTQGPSLEKQDTVMCQVLEAIAKAEERV